MASLAIKSALNPLATCFVPSTKFYGNNEVEISEVTKQENVKADSDKLNTEENSNDLETMETLDSTLENAELEHGMKTLTEDTDTENKSMVLFNLPTNDTRILSEKKASESELYVMEALAICHLILLTVFDFFYKHNYKDKSSGVPPAVEEIDEGSEEECHCPPMFGWVLPPTFLGNPLKLKYNCSKNRIHTSWYSGKAVDAICLPVANAYEKDGLGAYSFKVSNTLEQCSLELEMIIRDVCNSVSVYDSQFDFEENPEVIGSPTISELDESEEAERSIWNDVTVDEVLNETEIVDDGSHPLLQSVDSDHLTEGSNMDEVERILGNCLSPGKESNSLDCETKGNSVCSPPCSVWCDNLPLAVKETYCKFVRQIDSFDGISQVETKRQGTAGRPLFKRSLSADDSPRYANSSRGWRSALEAKSKENAMLFRRDPVSYIKQDHMLQVGERQHRSDSDSSEYNLRENCFSTLGKRSKSWGPFDGADSLWKPLPDCVPSSEDNPKHGPHRKFREMRRQRSVN